MCSTAASYSAWRRRISGSIDPIEKSWLELWLGARDLANWVGEGMDVFFVCHGGRKAKFGFWEGLGTKR
ncbi:hypothetical protein BCON_0127g00020 [Botryotinia convoluta]|uniref:Uncharacterized protein n=1 Tax=Botryotinia convoluta TaxID=54673 RepID=A0A4Z1HVI8_9HELO|nr:hypothetical protein BCON_0127g00020 [Botryotinia convoluta]